MGEGCVSRGSPSQSSAVRARAGGRSGASPSARRGRARSAARPASTACPEASSAASTRTRAPGERGPALRSCVTSPTAVRSASVSPSPRFARIRRRSAARVSGWSPSPPSTWSGRGGGGTPALAAQATIAARTSPQFCAHDSCRPRARSPCTGRSSSPPRAGSPERQSMAPTAMRRSSSPGLKSASRFASGPARAAPPSRSAASSARRRSGQCCRRSARASRVRRSPASIAERPGSGAPTARPSSSSARRCEPLRIACWATPSASPARCWAAASGRPTVASS